MTAKEWLSRARKMSGRLRALQTSKEQAFARATSVVVGGGEHVSGGEPADKHAAYAELSLAVDRQIEKLERTRAEIAAEQHYSWRQVMRLHGHALQMIRDMTGME